MSKLSVNKLISKAQAHSKQGEIEKAKGLYEQILRKFPKNKRARIGLSSIVSADQNIFGSSIPLNLLEEIETLYSRGKFQIVVDKINDLLKFYPSVSIPWMILGAASAQIRNFDQAILAFKTAISSDPKNSELYYNLGTAYKNSGELDAAIKAYEAAINLNPKHVFALNNLGTILKEKKMLDEAIAVYRQAIYADPNYAYAYNNLGVALAAKEYFEEAQISYQKAIEINPQYSQAYYNLAHVLHKRGLLEASIHASERALLVEPNYPEALINLGNVLQAKGELDASIKVLNKAILLSPNSAIPHFNLGNVLCEQEKFTDSVSSYKNALSIDAEYIEAHVNLGRVLRLQKKFEDAFWAYKNAIHLQTDHAEAYYGAGSCLKELDEFDEAISYYKLAQKFNPNLEDAFVSEAIALKLQGRLQEAASKLRSAASLHKGSSSIHKALGDIFQELDHPEEAIGSYISAISLNPFDAELQNNYGNVLKDLGLFEKAIKAFTKALELSPTYDSVRTNLGLLHWRKMNFKLAFDLMEWRWSGEDKFAESKFEGKKPTWNGVEREEIFVWKEQGIGDEIMFGSMIPELNEKSGGLVIECDRRLIPLYERSFPVNIRFIDDRTQLSLDDYDSHIAIGSLAKHFRHDLKDFKNVASGWLKADAKRVDSIRSSLSNDEPDRIVGISWFTESTAKGSEKRNIPLNILANYVKKMPGRLVSLQYGDTADDIKKLNEDHGVEIITLEELDLYNDIDGLAALISACDVVISIDNLTVHLAGALGADTRVLLPALPDVRWGTNERESYWYDYLTLYRQDKPGEWGAQLERLLSDICG